MAKKTSKAKTRAKPKVKVDGEAVKGGDLMKMPSVAAVTSLAKDITAAKKQTGGISKELAEIVAEAKSSKGIHPGALKRVEALLTKAKATDRGLAAVATELAHFDYYRDVLGLTKMLEEQGQMFARTEAGEPEQAGEDEPAPKTGLPFGHHVAKIAQDAGAKASS